jgi:hypothetical protein
MEKQNQQEFFFAFKEGEDKEREREFCGGNIDDAWYGTWHTLSGL